LIYLTVNPVLLARGTRTPLFDDNEVKKALDSAAATESDPLTKWPRPSVIADDGQPLALGLESHENFRLEPDGVLVFVHRHMLEAPGDLCRQRRDLVICAQ
jgi:hypothetical protein